jgi:hypothetical protein
MTRTKLNERLVVFVKGKNLKGDDLKVAIRPSDVVEVYPDPRYHGLEDGPWTKIILRNKSEHTVNHEFSVVISLLNRLLPVDDMGEE